ncbi:hypothetical protein GLOIN_2v1568987, partial [Rhizophagus irregularis DAOM 181602=DAOM 197198]
MDSLIFTSVYLFFFQICMIFLEGSFLYPEKITEYLLRIYNIYVGISFLLTYMCCSL